jgi:dTDP-glucose 4,6-dehydratase
MANRTDFDISKDCGRLISNVNGKLDLLKDSALLITGGTGFLGTWICEIINYLNKEYSFNTKLYLISRESEHFYDNLIHLNDVNINYIRSDVKNIIELPHDVNYIIHAAGTPDSRYHTSNPMRTMMDIGEGTGALLRAASRLPHLRMFLNVSSGNVYGYNDNDKRISEDDVGISDFGNISSAYAEAKRYAETLITAARSEIRLPVVTIRPFTFIGPFQPLDAPWAANNFISDALSKRPIRILGNGETVRGYLYGGDFAIWSLIVLCNTKSGKVYNIGSDQSIRLDDLARKISEKFNPSPEIVFNASLVGNVPKTNIVADISRLKKDFGVEVYTMIDEAIDLSIQWYKEDVK